MEMISFFENVYKDKTVLITGDTGFKGSWLAIWLLNLGAKVIGYSLEPKTSEDNFVVTGIDKKIKHINADIRDYGKLLAVLEQYKPEIIFHLAAQPLVLESYETPLETFSTNIMGTVNLLEAARKISSVRVIINVTSDKCYENREWIYGYRETDPLGGKDPYSASKAASEIITSSYINSFFSAENSACLASARAGNVIGGGDFSENRIFPDCIRTLKENRDILIRNPESNRPWQHVLESLSGYLTLGSLLYRDGKKFSGAWNFGPSSKNIVTVRRLVEEVIHFWGEGSYIIDEKANVKPEANLLQLDISRAVNLLKWHPVLSFSECVRLSVEEYRTEGMSKQEIFSQRIKHIEEYTKLRLEENKKNV